MRLLFGSIIAAASLLSSAGCSNEAQSPIVGAWKNVSPSQFGRAVSHYEFRADGTYTWKVEFPDFDRVAREQMYPFVFAGLITTLARGNYSITQEELVLSPEQVDGLLTGDRDGKRSSSIEAYDYIYPYEFKDETLLLYVEATKPVVYTRQDTGLFSRWFD